MNKNQAKSLNVWTRFQPYSVDPLDYDYDVHHLVMRSVIASLVSIYKEGEITPQLARSWSNSNNFKIWEITLANNWSFSNGEKITPEDILKNFKRVVLVKRKENSKSGLLEYLVGYSEFNSISDNLSGLYLKDQKLIFEFNKSMPDFLEKISFGLYGIAHPNDYDSNGKWLNPKNGITSGAYKIKNWTSDFIEIELATTNNNYNYDLIKFHSSKDLKEIRSSDIVFFDQKNPYLIKDEWEYVSKTQNNAILYVQVMNWDKADTFYSNRKNRQNLRNQYYKYLKKIGYKVTQSFFPLEINDISEFHTDSNQEKLDLREIRTQHFIYSEDFFKLGVIERGKFFKNALEELAAEHDIKIVYNDYPENRADEKNVFDIQFLGTSILIENPKEDIDFMFNSKHGIQLPDENGDIIKLLSNKNFNVQEVNQKLWDQAIVWPITHSSSGMWVKKSSKINYTKMNSSAHPLDAQFLYWK